MLRAVLFALPVHESCCGDDPVSVYHRFLTSVYDSQIHVARAHDS
jgi:hypothetical protein